MGLLVLIGIIFFVVVYGLGFFRGSDSFGLTAKVGVIPI